MNITIMEAAGFGEEVARVRAHKCPICHKDIKMNKFRDELSRREFKISGCCQTCQDDMFDEVE
jgi:hypothetical protein